MSLVEGCAFRAVLLTYDLRLEDWPENTHGKNQKASMRCGE